QASEGTWAWTDGTPASYTNWNAGEPNNSSSTEHYAEMLGSNGRWNDLNNAGATYPHLAVIEFGPSAPPCPADFNDDGTVNGDDLGTLLGAWAQTGTPFDLDGDGIVDGNDLGTLLSAWGSCTG
ncbi:MAG: lectin-like protein, partial [Phycisphaerales bacterium]